MRTITPAVDIVVDAANHIGETPIWVAHEQALYWINCYEPPELHRWNATTNEHRVWPMPQRIGGVAPTAAGGLIVALADGLYDFNTADGSVKLRAKSPLPPHVALHETGVDRQGRLWVGGFALNMARPQDSPKDAVLFRLDGDHLLPMTSGITVSNGLAVSPNGRVLFHTDCISGLLQQWDLDPATGNISNPRDFVRFSVDEGVMDGATVDAEGGYWSSLMMAGKLRRYLLDGTLDLEVILPFRYPTMVTFGGANLDTLYITSANPGFGEPQHSSVKAGGVFSFKPGLIGLPQPLVM